MTDKKKNYCSTCNYSASSKYCLERHFSTKKHIKNNQTGCEIGGEIITVDISNNNHEILEEIKKMNELSKNQEIEMKKMTNIISSQALMLADLKQNQLATTINNNNKTINSFNINIFLNESCGNAINFEDFIKNILFEHADSKLMIDSYVEGTCNIIKRNLEELPINKRPLHYLVGEDPHQKLMHIRQDNEWNIGTELNWMQQIHADDDDHL